MGGFYPIFICVVLVGRSFGSTARLIYLGCSDTDAGKDYGVRGTVTATYSTGGETETREFTDRCSATGAKILECYCREKRKTYAIKTCPSGVCSDGACS